jgi:hypothetical protein
MDNTLITLGDYLKKGLPFVVPYYQRGYIWGKSRDTQKDSISFLMESIMNCFENEAELFLQGITVSENPDKIELIDGQQRTTAIYLLLHYLGYNGKFDINYSVRKESDNFLKSLKSSSDIIVLCNEDKFEKFQDIYYFKKTIRIIHKNLKNKDKQYKQLLHTFLLDKVKFLYINIPNDKATMVFSMMNGNKAPMQCEEIIKAEMLRLISQEQDIQSQVPTEQEGERWEQNLLRSRYAREWDKWLYWWNRDEVKKYYHTEKVMGLLVETYYEKNKKRKYDFNFENFRDFLLRGKNNSLEAKNVFDGLRRLQKKIEDVYNSVNDDKKLHNKIGAILTLLPDKEREKFCKDYFGGNKVENIDEYLKLVYLGISHTEIIKYLSNTLDTQKNKDEKDVVQSKKDELIGALENDELYWSNDYKEFAFRQLLRRNIEEDSRLGRKFDFAIWKERSLEHIFPKSKVYYKKGGRLFRGNEKPEGEDIEITDNAKTGLLYRAAFKEYGSEHCIGNLVLLYRNENSEFHTKDFDEKKSLYFDLIRDKDKPFHSRHLLHSIAVFAKSKWSIEEIQQNKRDFIKETKNYYEIH